MTTASSDIPEPVQTVLQGYLDGLNASDPTHHQPPWTHVIFRHPCPRARYPGRSESITLHERYVTIADVLASKGFTPTEDAGDFAIIFKEGSCSRCLQTARSAIGRVVRTDERPPIEGRVGR